MWWEYGTGIARDSWYSGKKYCRSGDEAIRTMLDSILILSALREVDVAR